MALLVTVLVAALAALAVRSLVRWLGSLDDRARRWIAGFFEQGTVQSSTRLVGILSFVTGVCMCAGVVIALIVGAWLKVLALANPSPSFTTLLTVAIGILFTNGCVALGLRKGGEAANDPPTDTADHGPLVPAEAPKT